MNGPAPSSPLRASPRPADTNPSPLDARAAEIYQHQQGLGRPITWRAAYRKALGWTQQQAAEAYNHHHDAAGTSPWTGKRVSALENWPDNNTEFITGQVLERWGKVLGTHPRNLLSDTEYLHPRLAAQHRPYIDHPPTTPRQQREPGAPEVQTSSSGSSLQASTPALLSANPRKDDQHNPLGGFGLNDGLFPANLTTRLRDSSGSTAAALSIHLVDATASSSPQAFSMDRRFLQAHQKIAEGLAATYRGGDPGSILPMAVPYADSLLNLLDSPMRDVEWNEINAISVDVHAQIGLWACHMHQSALAHRYLSSACEIAAEGADQLRYACALGALSYLYSSAPRGGYGGRPRRALALLDKALDIAGRRDDFTCGWLATWRADQHATLGDLTQARRDVEIADHGLQADRSAHLTGFFSQTHYGYGMAGHLDSVRAVVFALEGNAAEAEGTFAGVQGSAANMRRRVATFGHEALSHVANHDAEAAAVTLRHSMVLAIQGNYVMGVRRAVGVRHGFKPEWAALPAVRAFDEEFRHLVS
ncbi:MAG: hypothetical protein ACJ73S_03730 [Mycobacteriales bacterium]